MRALGLNGALSISVGVIILHWPGITLLALTILFGANMTASRIIGLVAAGGGTVQQNRGWLVFGSILSIAAGISVLVWPNIGGLALLARAGATRERSARTD